MYRVVCPPTAAKVSGDFFSRVVQRNSSVLEVANFSYWHSFNVHNDGELVPVFLSHP